MNNNGPFGFRYMGLAEGMQPNFGLAQGFCAADADPIFSGDVLSITAGLLSAADVVMDGAQIAGLAVSFEWVSISRGYKVRQRWYPGNDSVNNAPVTVFYANNGQAIFEVQSAGTSGDPVTQAAVGSFANFAVGAGGNTQSGNSSYSLDDNTINSTQGDLPFVITAIEGPPKTDPASIYNLVRVKAVNINPGA